MTITGDYTMQPEKFRHAAQEAFRKGKPWEGVELVRQAEGYAGWKKSHHLSEWFFQLKVWCARYQAEVLQECKEWALHPREVYELSGLLKDGSEFGHARRLLARLAGEPWDLLLSAPEGDHAQRDILLQAGDKLFYRRVIQRLALCTYKDPDIHPARALKEAERLLNAIGLNGTETPDTETLGLGGAVFKRKWELTGQVEHLYQSLHYYRMGWEKHKDGYGGINAAFIMDKIAAWFADHGHDQGQAKVNRDAALEIRLEIIAHFPGSEDPSKELMENTGKWDVATLAEALFGLGDEETDQEKYFLSARKWFAATAVKLGGEWERKTCFQQVVALGRMRGFRLPAPEEHIERWHPAWQALAALLEGEAATGEKTYPALTGYPGKVGLALSGGGFRAAFYHLGVMARLAEIDALRRVEVISTVSGGSIVGAHYALKLKKMMEDKQSGELDRAHYIGLMKCLIGEFYLGVSGNMRMRALSSVKTLLGMIINLECSTTRRLGDLYEEKFYAPALGEVASKPVQLTDLLIQPKDNEQAFSPRSHNWRVANKIPILLINATNLNSGHSWQFTGTYMGEPPGLLEADIDANQRFARLRFDAPEETNCTTLTGKCRLRGGNVTEYKKANPIVKELCKDMPVEEAAGAVCHCRKRRKDYRQFRLGQAVAASSCVPMLFTPVLLGNIYPGQNLRLADGGVYDNQGVDTLLQESCSLIFCSDASGQLNNQDSPSIRRVDVFRRANDITMERSRILQYQDMCGRLEAHTLGGMMFVHLRQGLDIQRISPCKRAEDEQGDTGYGISKKMQRLLSCIRTDLDSFTEVEAYSLMLSGYCATGVQLEEMERNGLLGDFDTQSSPETDWPFLAAKPYLGENGDDVPKEARKDVEEQLDKAKKLFFKPFLLGLAPWLKSTFVLAIFAAAIWCVAQTLKVSCWKLTVLLVLLPAGLGAIAILLKAPSSCQKIGIPGGLLDAIWHGADVALTGYLCIAAWYQRLMLNDSFLSRGKLDRLEKQEATPS